jgi:type I restriction enzyme, S subunit
MPWPAVPLGSIATIDRQGIAPHAIEPGSLYVGLENIQRGGAFTEVHPTTDGQLASTKFRFDERHVLFGKLRPNLAKIARPSFSGICSTDILPIRPGPSLDRDYLAHFLARPASVAQAASRAAGVNLPRLSPAELLRFKLPLPPIEEQRRIADILDRVDALRATRREALALLDDLTQSIFLDMFGRPDARWPRVIVGDLADRGAGGIRTGPFGSQLLHSEFVDEGVAVLGIDNAVTNRFAWSERRYINPQKYAQLKRYTIHPGDVLITIMGTCGRAAIVPDDIPLAINTKHLCCITLDRSRCLPEYLHAYFLRHPAAREYLTRTAKGAIMSGLNMGIVKSMPIEIPPVKLQAEFATRLRALESCEEAQRNHRDKIEGLWASLQQRAFAGEL